MRLHSGYQVEHTHTGAKSKTLKNKFEVTLGPNEMITISTVKDLVAVAIHGGADSKKFFGNSVGVMGSYNGTLVARDGMTVMTDINKFGQEWQVTDDEPMLFGTARSPQYPSQCILPSPKATRRLGETDVAKKATEDDCAHLSGASFDICVVGIMTVGDVAVAALAF